MDFLMCHSVSTHFPIQIPITKPQISQGNHPRRHIAGEPATPNQHQRLPQRDICEAALLHQELYGSIGHGQGLLAAGEMSKSWAFAFTGRERFHFETQKVHVYM